MHTHRILAACVVTLVALGCTGSADVTGSYDGAGTTPLPAELGLPPGATLDVVAAATFVDPSEGRFDLALTLTYVVDAATSTVLTDTIDLGGTYVAANGVLTLSITEIAPGEGGTVLEAEGSRCVQLSGFASTRVCFPAQQSNPYAIEGGALAITLDQVIATTEGSTRLDLARRP